MRERYERLKLAAVETLVELGYLREGVDFDKARYWPYPLLRYQIARELYNLPGTSLTSIGRLMGVKHSTLSVGLDKTSSFLTVRDAEVTRLFREKAKGIGISHVDEVWSIDDDHSILYLLIMEEKGRGLMTDDAFGWYSENDDLAQYIVTQ